jgi:hypothetical protein
LIKRALSAQGSKNHVAAYDSQLGLGQCLRDTGIQASKMFHAPDTITVVVSGQKHEKMPTPQNPKRRQVFGTCRIHFNKSEVCSAYLQSGR